MNLLKHNDDNDDTDDDTDDGDDSDNHSDDDMMMMILMMMNDNRTVWRRLQTTNGINIDSIAEYDQWTIVVMMIILLSYESISIVSKATCLYQVRVFFQ